MSTVETTEALDALPPEIAVYPGTDADDQHVYIRDTTEGCWVAYVRADCVGVDEIPLPAYVPSQTAADQPTTEPSEVRYAVARALACVGADRSYTGPRFDGASDDDPAKDYWLRRADAALAVLAPTPQPAAERYDGTWDESQWEEWSNDVASEMPEEWDSDEGQEAIILRFVKYATAHLAATAQPAADTGGLHPDDLRRRLPSITTPLSSDSERDERLRDIQQRVEAATEGPWHLDSVGDSGIYTEPHPSPTSKDVASAFEREDEEFIAAARTDVPWLLAEVTRLDAVVTAVRDIHKRNPLWDDEVEKAAGYNNTDDMCVECWDDWPCDTVKILDGVA